MGECKFVELRTRFLSDLWNGGVPHLRMRNCESRGICVCACVYNAYQWIGQNETLNTICASFSTNFACTEIKTDLASIVSTVHGLNSSNHVLETSKITRKRIGQNRMAIEVKL